MQLKKIFESSTSKKAFDYVQLAITTASICIAIAIVGVNYVYVLGY